MCIRDRNYAYNNVQSNREAWDGSQMYDQTGFLKNRLTSAWKTNFQTGQYRSSYYVQNASFVRMDNISLGYTFNLSLIHIECENGYHRYFNEWAEKDMINMLHQYRNNPCVVMWLSLIHICP